MVVCRARACAGMVDATSSVTFGGVRGEVQLAWRALYVKDAILKRVANLEVDGRKLSYVTLKPHICQPHIHVSATLPSTCRAYYSHRGYPPQPHYIASRATGRTQAALVWEASGAPESTMPYTRASYLLPEQSRWSMRWGKHKAASRYPHTSWTTSEVAANAPPQLPLKRLWIYHHDSLN